jgi:hypothetical protein
MDTDTKGLPTKMTAHNANEIAIVIPNPIINVCLVYISTGTRGRAFVPYSQIVQTIAMSTASRKNYHHQVERVRDAAPRIVATNYARVPSGSNDSYISLFDTIGGDFHIYPSPDAKIRKRLMVKLYGVSGDA